MMMESDSLRQEREKVFRAFFEEGRLLALPVKRKKRLLVLDVFIRHFEAGRDYTEAEVNAVIVPVFSDYCTIRRELVDFGFMERENSVYRRKRVDGWLPEL